MYVNHSFRLQSDILYIKNDWFKIMASLFAQTHRGKNVKYDSLIVTSYALKGDKVYNIFPKILFTDILQRRSDRVDQELDFIVKRVVDSDRVSEPRWRRHSASLSSNSLRSHPLLRLDQILQISLLFIHHEPVGRNNFQVPTISFSS